jgi:hypothetical protein
MRWELLPYPTPSLGMVQSDFHLFGPLKGTLGGKKLTADNEQVLHFGKKTVIKQFL